MLHVCKRGMAFAVTLLMIFSMLFTGIISVSAAETTQLIWDMEDKAVISQLITADSQKATIAQSTQYKRGGNASLMFVNSGRSGLMGNITPFVDVDLTGWDKIRFYINNPTDMEAGLRWQFCGGMTGNTPYYLDVEIPANTDGFIPIDFPLADFEAIEYIAQGSFYDLAQPYEYVIADSALIFTGPNTGERLYIDDVMLVKGSAQSTTTTKKTPDKTTTTKTGETTGSESLTTTTVADTVTTGAGETQTTVSGTESTGTGAVDTLGDGGNDKPDGGFPVWAIITIVAVVLAAAGTGAFFLIKKKA